MIDVRARSTGGSKPFNPTHARFSIETTDITNNNAERHSSSSGVSRVIHEQCTQQWQEVLVTTTDHVAPNYTNSLAAGMRYHRQWKQSMEQYLTPSRNPSSAPVSSLAKKRKATQPLKTAFGDNDQTGRPDDTDEAGVPLRPNRMRLSILATMPSPAARRSIAAPVEAYAKDSLQQSLQQTLEAVRQTQFMLLFTFHDA